MPKVRDPNIETKSLALRKGDFERIGELFPDQRPTAVIRRIISQFVDKVNSASPEANMGEQQ